MRHALKTRALVMLMLLLPLILQPQRCLAQTVTVLKTGAKELCEQILKRGGAEAAEQLATVGGETAARELLEQAAREGGESLVREVSEFALSHGPLALSVLTRSPAKLIGAFKGLSPEMIDPAFRAAMREPDLVARLVTTFGKDALVIAAKHPGVGTRLVDILGEDGIRIGNKLSTDEAIQLTRYADQIKSLPLSERERLLGALEKTPGKILDALESHPNVLLAAGGVVIVLGVKDNIIGSKGEPGVVERLAIGTLHLFQSPISAILLVVAALILGWSIVQVWHVWKLKRIKQAVEQSKAQTQIAKSP